MKADCAGLQKDIAWLRNWAVKQEERNCNLKCCVLEINSPDFIHKNDGLSLSLALYKSMGITDYIESTSGSESL